MNTDVATVYSLIYMGICMNIKILLYIVLSVFRNKHYPIYMVLAEYSLYSLVIVSRSFMSFQFIFLTV